MKKDFVLIPQPGVLFNQRAYPQGNVALSAPTDFLVRAIAGSGSTNMLDLGLLGKTLAALDSLGKVSQLLLLSDR